MIGLSRGDGSEPYAINSSAARSARICDYLLGGASYFAVDREHCEFVFEGAYPGGIEGARADAWANRRFVLNSVHYLAADVGVRQFLDIGCGLPAVDNAQAVALKACPDARVVYVDHDPIVLAHAHLLAPPHRDRTDFVFADVQRLDSVVARATETLDFARPIGVILTAVLQHIADEDDPHGLVAELVHTLEPGSYVVISHVTGDLHPEPMAEVERRWAKTRADHTIAHRARWQVTQFLDELELVAPGLVRLDEWPLDTDLTPACLSDRVTPIYVAVGKVVRGSAPARRHGRGERRCAWRGTPPSYRPSLDGRPQQQRHTRPGDEDEVTGQVAPVGFDARS